MDGPILTRSPRNLIPTYFFPPDVFYDDLDCVARLLKAAGVTIIQMNDAETILRIGCRLASSIGAHLVYEAHYHTSTLATALGAHPDRTAALRLMEAEVCQRVDHLIVFTEADRHRWLSLSHVSEDRISIVPFGVASSSGPDRSTHREGVVFIGNLFYEPNRRAVERIARDILPAIRAHRSEIRPDIAHRYFRFLDIEDWVARWCRANRELATRTGLIDPEPCRLSTRGRRDVGRGSGATSSTR